jgi:hypothetical protein
MIGHTITHMQFLKFRHSALLNLSYKGKCSLFYPAVPCQIVHPSTSMRACFCSYGMLVQFGLLCFAQLCIRQMHYILRGSKHLVKFLVHSSFGLQVKNRWAGKTIVDLFTDEFKGRSRDYYVWCHYFFRISCTILFLFITRHCGYIISLSALQSYFVEICP